MTSHANDCTFNVVDDQGHEFPNEEHFVLNGTNDYVDLHANMVADINGKTLSKSFAKEHETLVESKLQQLIVMIEVCLTQLSLGFFINKSCYISIQNLRFILYFFNDRS